MSLSSWSLLNVPTKKKQRYFFEKCLNFAFIVKYNNINKNDLITNIFHYEIILTQISCNPKKQNIKKTD